MSSTEDGKYREAVELSLRFCGYRERSKKEINTMDSGQVLHVISTDPGAVMDFESFATQTGNEILSSEEKDNSQKVKDIVSILKDNNLNEGIEHQKTHRPWGNFVTLIKGENWKVKKIFVKPYECLSLQKHLKRTEHWVIIKGKGKVIIDNKTSIVNENESVYIPKGSKHRLINEEEKSLILIEIQSGSYLGEDDLVRFEDNYGRIK